MKQILLTLAIALLALGAWMVLGTSTSVAPVVGPLPTAPSTAASAPERDAPELEQVAVERSAGPERSAVEADGVASAATATAAGELTFSEPVEDGIEFQVLVEATGEPLPHAILTAIGQARAEEGGAQELMMAGMGIDAILDAIGAHYRCDAEGRVAIDPRDADALIRGRGEVDGRMHSGMAEGDPGVRTVSVRPVAGFEVTVVDAAGAPLPGAGVELVIEREIGPMSQRMAFNAAEADAEGRAFLTNTIAGLPGEAERMVEDARVLVSLAGLYRERPEVEVDWRATDPEPIELVAPDVAEVAVTLTLPDGEPPAGILVLHLPGIEDSMLGMPVGGSLIRSVTGEQAAAGPVVFATVERGLAFSLTYEVEGQRDPQVRTGLVVPTDRARFEVELELSLDVPRLAGRVLLPSGEPLAETEVLVGRTRSWRVTAEPLDRVTTDPEGRFVLPAPWLGESGLLVWYRTSSGEELAAGLPTGGSVVGGIHDVGDLTLEGEVLLLSGRVVDPDGQGVSVQLSLVEHGASPGIVRAVGVEGTGGTVSRVVETRRWETRSSDSGAFSFHGRTDADALTLTTRSDDFLAPEALEIPVGTEDLVVTLERAARFHFELPDLHPVLVSSIYLVVPGEGEGTSFHTVRDGWSPPLPAGTHDYYLCLGGGRESAIHEGTVQLAPGEQRELGLLVLQRQVLHYELDIQVVGQHDTSGLYVYGRRAVTEPGGSVRMTHLGHSTRDWTGVGEGGDLHHLFSLEPADEVVVVLGSAELVAPVTEGKNTIVFDPSQHQQESDLTPAQVEALEGLGYL